MADKQPVLGSSAEEQTTENREAPAALAPNCSSTSMQAEERELTPASGRGGEADVSSGCLCSQPEVCQFGDEDWKAKMFVPETRRRGRTISSRPRNLGAPPLSPSSQMFGKEPSTNRGDGNGEGGLGPILERGQAPPATRRPRRSTNSECPSLSSRGMKPRTSTRADGPNRTRGGTLIYPRSCTLSTRKQHERSSRRRDERLRGITVLVLARSAYDLWGVSG